MALFKCIKSGTVVEFTAQHDIDEMKRHPEYQAVDVPVVAQDVKDDGTRQTIILRKPTGRPRKEQLL
jgi:hypothetical protein